jgi:hypothetical protein
MSKYSRHDEEMIRVERLVREWRRSGLLDKAQEDRILPELHTDLRRTNIFLRAILFGFGLLIILSAVLLFGVTLSLNDEWPAATLCVLGAGASLWLSNCLIDRFRLYRFGIEEAAAIAGGVLLAVAAGLIASLPAVRQTGDFTLFIGLIFGSLAGLAIYIRYAYLYAAVAGLLCMGLVPFQLGMPEGVQRLVSAGGFAVAFIVIGSMKRGETDYDFPADDYTTLQAISWFGAYASLNLYLSSLGWLFGTGTVIAIGLFYWFSYVAIWVVPIAGLLVALRARERALIDVNIGLFLLTLATNKPYLGLVRQTWDPILLGIFLIITAIVLRRWLSSRPQSGFTVERILLSDQRGISVLGTASAVLHTVPNQPTDRVPVREFDPAGGRSGGAGASGSF